MKQNLTTQVNETGGNTSYGAFKIFKGQDTFWKMIAKAGML